MSQVGVGFFEELKQETSAFVLRHQVVKNQGGQFFRRNHPFAREQELAVCKEMGSGVGLECMGFFDLSAPAGHMHFGLSDLDLWKFRCGFFQDRIVKFARFAGGETIGHDGARTVGELFIISVADLEDRAHTVCRK